MIDAQSRKIKGLHGNPSYFARFTNKGYFADHFIRKYHESLFFYKHFYDDVWEYGSLENAEAVYYFIPGFNGTPGQFKFGLPALHELHGNRFYTRCLYLEEFSCFEPTWLKYTEQNLIKRQNKIVADLESLLHHGLPVFIIASSIGYYDLVSVSEKIQALTGAGEIKRVYWLSCAPDKVEKSRWLNLFKKFNGFDFNGFAWFAYPNSQWLKIFNPETSTEISFRFRGQKNRFYKNDLESRFYVNNTMWDYASTGLCNYVLDFYLNSDTAAKIPFETIALAGVKDGFWSDSSPSSIGRTVANYSESNKIVYKDRNHLWVVTPENLAELLYT